MACKPGMALPMRPARQALSLLCSEASGSTGSLINTTALPINWPTFQEGQLGATVLEAMKKGESM
jgi:hypothetical protein